MTVIEVVDEPRRPARDRGQGAEARLYLEGPRDPLRGSAGGSRGLDHRRRPRTRRQRRPAPERKQDDIDVETDASIGTCRTLDSD